MAARPLLGESLGTALLLFVIVGSGIAVERGGGDLTSQLFAHAVAVGAGLAALIALLAPVSGAHFNPAVTVGFWRTRLLGASTCVGYVVAQLAGACVGVVVANATFGEAAISLATTPRGGPGNSAAEFVATYVLVLLILGLVRTGRERAVPATVGAWVGAVIVATVSTGFTNPAVTIARLFSDTFTGIAPGSVPVFVAVQMVGAVCAVSSVRFLFPHDDEVDPQSDEEVPRDVPAHR